MPQRTKVEHDNLRKTFSKDLEAMRVIGGIEYYIFKEKETFSLKNEFDEVILENMAEMNFKDNDIIYRKKMPAKFAYDDKNEEENNVFLNLANFSLKKVKLTGWTPKLLLNKEIFDLKEQLALQTIINFKNKLFAGANSLIGGINISETLQHLEYDINIKWRLIHTDLDDQTKFELKPVIDIFKDDLKGVTSKVVNNNIYNKLNDISIDFDSLCKNLYDNGTIKIDNVNLEKVLDTINNKYFVGELSFKDLIMKTIEEELPKKISETKKLKQ